MCSTPLALLLVLSTASCFELLPEEAAPRRARFLLQHPTDVARCLNGAVTVGCGFFSCLENSTCDTDGMHEICELYYSTLLQTLQSCDEETVSAVRAGLYFSFGSRHGDFPAASSEPTVFCRFCRSLCVQQTRPAGRTHLCSTSSRGFRGRDPTHLFARKRSVDDMEGGVNAEQ
ncbi:hypothetical protein KUCAC02_035025 [Chaenocephalus aceratus]|nr:hypothetical protein KUCAC02_035025 [Chaenocephalus aceratus]